MPLNVLDEFISPRQQVSAGGEMVAHSPNDEAPNGAMVRPIEFEAVMEPTFGLFYAHLHFEFRRITPCAKW